MKKIFVVALFTVVISALFPTAVKAQCDTTADMCAKHMVSGFISDGQNYRALLLNQEVAEFHATFFGGSVYRIAACSGQSDGNLLFNIFDKERNLLFSNAEYKNAPYWDFKFDNTIDCIIEAQLSSSNAASGCAVLLMGFKQQ
jgi:hypothetical protein